MNFSVAGTNTPDYTFTEGAVYFPGKEKFYEGETDVTFVPYPGVSKHIVYYAPANDCGADKVLVHSWGDNGDVRGWNFNEPMEDWIAPNGNRYFTVTPGGEIRYIYKYEFYYIGNVTHVIFHIGSTQTGSLPFTEGGLYGSDSQIINPKYIFDDPDNYFIPGEELVEYTAYFCQGLGYNYAPEDIRVHVWGTSWGLNEWKDNEGMELWISEETGEPYHYEIEEGIFLPVYKYTFSAKESVTPGNIIFHSPDGSTLKTKDEVFTEGKIYLFQGNDKYCNQLTAAQLTDRHLTYPTFTVYFAPGTTTDLVTGKNRYWTPEECRVHVWGNDKWGNGFDVKQWADDEFMEPWYSDETGNQLSIVADDRSYRPVYKYTFTCMFGQIPEQLVFRSYLKKEDGTFTEWQTDNETFTDGKIYIWTRGGQSAAEGSADALRHEPMNVTKSIYWADTDVWTGEDGGWLEPLVFKFDGKDYIPYLNTALDPTWTNKRIKMNGRYYPVHKLDIEAGGAVDSVMMYHNKGAGSRYTPYYPVKDGGVYYFVGSGITAPVRDLSEYEIVDEVTDDMVDHSPVTLYFHLGAAQVMNLSLWRDPCCLPYKRRDCHADVWGAFPHYTDRNGEAQDALTFPEYNSEEMEQCRMEQIKPGFYKYTVADRSTFDDVCLFYYANHRDPDTNEVSIQVHDQMTLSRSPYYDATQISDYIYDIGLNCFHQSYITYDEWLKHNEEAPYDYISVVGDGKFAEVIGNDPGYAMTIPEDHGCYFLDFEIDESKAADFKLSTIDVNQIITEKILSQPDIPDTYYHWQRGWATFNQGLIGLDALAFSDNYSEWYGQHVVGREDGATQCVVIDIDETLRYDDYCQLPWRIEASTDGAGIGVKPGHYWLVVDVLDDDHSVTLLDFNPHPKCTASSIAINSVKLTDDESFSLHDGQYLEACAYNGNVGHRTANVASGTLDIEAVGEDLVNNQGFDVVYTIYVEDEPDISHKGIPGQMTVDYLNVDNDSTYLGVRARFHDKTRDTYFRTRFSYGNVQFDLDELPKPQPELRDKGLRLYLADADADQPYALGGVTDIDYVLNNPANLIYHPDYTVTSAKVDDALLAGVNAPIIHKGHYVVSNANPWHTYLGKGTGTVWEPYSSEGMATEDRHHWADQVVQTRKLPIVFEDLLRTDDIELSHADANVEVDIHASYPFVVRRHGRDLQVSQRPAYKSAPAKAGELAESLPDTADKFYMLQLRQTAPLSVPFDSEVVTGVENISTDTCGSDSDAVYYNLQGVRVDHPTPGIYIVVRGTVTTKEVVR